MRCDNCGWDNPDDNVKCEKCNVLLNSSGGRESYSRDVQEYAGDDRNIKKTVFESGSAVAEQADIKTITRCPECGYPLRSSDDTCPDCGAFIDTDAFDSAPAQADVDEREVKTVRYAAGKLPHAEATINPWEKAIEEEIVEEEEAEPEEEVIPEPVVCYLKPLPRENEAEKERVEFNEDTVVLNRDNTEPDNPTITSRQQAVLRYRDGKWYVEDLSELQTTFIRVKDPTEIKDGDILLMGDRQFLFNCE